MNCIKKTETKKLKNFPVGYVGRLYRYLAQKHRYSSVNEHFYDKVANDPDIPSEDVQKYMLTTSNFTIGIQDDINLYVMRDPRTLSPTVFSAGKTHLNLYFKTFLLLMHKIF